MPTTRGANFSPTDPNLAFVCASVMPVGAEALADPAGGC